MKTLVQAGIDPKRLTPYGNRPYPPVAANTTDDGRAKNCRVELVAQPHGARACGLAEKCIARSLAAI